MTAARFKPVPPAPDDLGAVAAARDAVPLVPGSEADCCGRIRAALDLPARDEARTWLTFLRALGLVRETSRGFARTRASRDGNGEDGGSEGSAVDRSSDGADVDRATLAASFRERVFGAREVLAALDDADGPLSAGAVFERVDGMVPEWERRRDPAGWEDRWRERVARLLSWAALLGLAERTDGGYRAAG